MLREITNEEIYIIAKEYAFGCDLFNLIFGLISNIFNILILSFIKDFRGNQCAFYLKIESIANIGLILTISPSNIISYKLNQDLTYIYLPWCKLKTTLAQIFGLCSVYTICFSAFYQYLSTSHRYYFRQICTIKFVYYLTICNIIFCTLHSLIFLIFNEINETFTCTIYNTILKKYLSFFYYPILNTGLPIIASGTFSLLAYYNVQHIIRRQIPIIRRRLDRQLTTMILTRIFCLISLGLPYIIYSLYQLNLTYTGDNFREIAIATLVGTICYSLLYANFAIMFYIFLLISSRFRRQVKWFLMKQYERLYKITRTRTTTGLNRNRIAPEIGDLVISDVNPS